MSNRAKAALGLLILAGLIVAAFCYRIVAAAWHMPWAPGQAP